MQLSAEDISELTRLEQAMWIAATRRDAVFQRARFASDFFEFGRSGRIDAREQVILTGDEEVKARPPLDGLQIRHLDGATAQVTYNSHVEHDGVVEHARRSSVWTGTDVGWVMRFHQGTPYEP